MHRPDATPQLSAILAERTLVIDGAMGTLIQAHQLTEADYRGELFADHHSDLKGDNDLLSLTRPELIRDIHRDYLAAGADLVCTNTFNATRISQADYGLEDHCYEINRASAALPEVIPDSNHRRTKLLFACFVMPTPSATSVAHADARCDRIAETSPRNRDVSRGPSV